jgi:hypothetical protein
MSRSNLKLQVLIEAFINMVNIVWDTRKDYFYFLTLLKKSSWRANIRLGT